MSDVGRITAADAASIPTEGQRTAVLTPQQQEARGEAFAAALFGIIVRHGPTGLRTSEQLEMGHRLSMTANEWVRSRNRGPESSVERFRHNVRGAEYDLIGVGRAQGVLSDDDPVVLYRGDDGSLWVRHHAEFFDGRFQRVTTTASSVGTDGPQSGPGATP